MIAPAFRRVVSIMLSVAVLAMAALVVDLGMLGLGLSIIIVWASVTLARWLKVRPTPRSAAEHVGLGRLSGCLVMAWLLVNTVLRSLEPSGAQAAQLDALLGIIIAYGVGFATLVFKRPKGSWRRRLAGLKASLGSSFSRPVMGGAGN